MATLATAGRDAMMNALTALFNNGNVFFRTAGAAEVAKCTFAATAFGASSAGVATAAAIADDTNADGGVIADCQLRKSDNTVILSLTVGVSGSGANAIITSLTVGAGETMQVPSAVLTMPAS